MITGTDFENGLINFKTSKYVSEFRYNQDKNIQLQNDDILITKDGTLGKVAIIRNLNKRATLNSGIYRIRINDLTKVDPEYLYQYLSAPFLLNFANKTSIGGTIKHLNQSQIVNFPIPFSTLEEQQKISKFLSHLDFKISIIKNKISTLKKYRKGIINSWFKNNEKTLRLCELVRQQTSQLLTHQIKDNIGTYPVYDATGRIYKSIDFYMNENDSIAIIKYGSGCGRTFITRDKHCVLGTMSELIPLNHDDLTYVFAFTESTKFKKICKKYIEVGTTPNLYYSDYSTELVYYPEERDNFVKLIDLINKKCVCLETEKENLGLLKRQLLKDMFI